MIRMSIRDNKKKSPSPAGCRFMWIDPEAKPQIFCGMYVF